MSASARTTAAVTLTTEADATELVKLRELFKSNKAPLVPSYNDFLIRIAAIALKDHPAVNGSDGPVHVGFAVDTERALLVPVVRNVQDASLVDIARESARLVERARAGQLTAEEMAGGTFTITNLGMYEIDAFTPIINIPEHAILGVGRIVAKQVVTDADAGTVAIRRMMVLSLTFDHRLGGRRACRAVPPAAQTCGGAAPLLDRRRIARGRRLLERASARGFRRAVHIAFSISSSRR